MRSTRATKKPRKAGEEGAPFSSTGDEAKAVKKILTENKQYITVQELRTPAKVVDKLRRDFANLKEFNRNSMKLAVRKILQHVEVVQKVNQFWGGGTEIGQDILNDHHEDQHVVSNC